MMMSMLALFSVSLTLTSVSPQDAVLIGDSQAQGLRNAGELTALGVTIYSACGKPVAHFHRWLLAHPNILDGKELVVFQMGGNDITLGHSAEAIIDDMTALANLARGLNPKARVVFGLIPVRGQWFDAQHKLRPHKAERQEIALDTVNQWLTRGQHAGFSVFAVNDIVADPETPRMQRSEFRRRGAADVHLNRSGYRALSSALAESLLLPN
jgi:lysophospholipase L1-like esterase